MAPFLANNFTLNLRLDENLDVTGAGIDEDGNYVSDGPATAATVDCDTVTMP